VQAEAGRDRCSRSRKRTGGSRCCLNSFD